MISSLTVPLAISFFWGMAVAFGISLFFMFRQMNSYEKDIEKLEKRMSVFSQIWGDEGR